MNDKQKRMLWRIGITAVWLMALQFIPVQGWLHLALYLVAYGIIGYDILRKAGKGIVNGRIFDENFLMTIATLGAFALAIYEQSGDYLEGIAVMLFYQIGEWFQSYAVGRSRKNISALMDIRPDYANIERDGKLEKVEPKESEESTVSKILELVEDSSSHKSQSENFITKFAKVYTPAVCLGALALAIIPPAIQLMYGHADPQWENWIYRALIFLVISCPCALVISIPLSFFSGIGGASREGILIKGSNYMETLAQTRYIAFDKTGTLTKGNFEVNGVHHNQMEKEELLAYAAMAECASSHPISKSLQQAYGKPIDRNRVRNIHEISGHGVKAAVDGHIVAVGNDKLMKQMKISYVPCHSMGTILHVAVDGRYAGHIVISDVIKPHARQAIAALKRNGIKQTVMLTGDTRRTAENIAKDVGVDQVYSELLPADKVNKVEQLLARKGEKEKLAFVGDGINDAPVLTRADIGIAMGAMGSDAAIEAADVVLMDDDPLQIANAILLSRKCLRIVYENIVFALGIKFLCLGLGAVGIANMWFAIFADVGVMILAILNAIRALYPPSVSIKKDSRKMVLQPQSE